MTKIRIVTHNAGFHADDVFGVATLMLLLGKDNVEVTRTRDTEIVDTADYVLDVGGVYDPEKNRFDHHQAGGAGTRANGIEYASFGLIWKKFGAQLCGSQSAADDIEERLVCQIDAHDNGLELYTPKVEGAYLYPITLAIFPFQPLTKEDPEAYDRCFFEAVNWVLELLSREIPFAKKRSTIFETVDAIYNSTKEHSILLIDRPGEFNREIIMERLAGYSDVLYFVREYATGVWQVVCTVDDIRSFKNRKDLPRAWWGKRDQELIDTTGVSDAIFCHRAGFMIVAQSKEGALRLAELALQAEN